MATSPSGSNVCLGSTLSFGAIEGHRVVEYLAEKIRGLFVGLRDEMRLDIQGGAGITMTQTPGNGSYINSSG